MEAPRPNAVRTFLAQNRAKISAWREREKATDAVVAAYRRELGLKRAR
jgi:hypothetical protein